jgi:hypothetical protein
MHKPLSLKTFVGVAVLVVAMLATGLALYVNDESGKRGDQKLYLMVLSGQYSSFYKKNHKYPPNLEILAEFMKPYQVPRVTPSWHPRLTVIMRGGQDYIHGEFDNPKNSANVILYAYP